MIRLVRKATALVLLLGAIVASPLAQAADRPPLEAYGRLPALEDAAI